MMRGMLRPRSTAATALGALDTVVALTFLIFALLHAGLRIQLGLAVLSEPSIVPATIVEALCCLALAASTAGLLTRRAWAWPAAVASHLFALCGILLGLAAGRGGGSTQSNTIYHIVTLVVLLATLAALLAPRVRAALSVMSLAVVLLLAACGARPNSTVKVKDFVADLNKQDLSGAMSLTAPNFSLTEANGTTMRGAAAESALKALPAPIKVVSLTHEGGHKARATLAFGSGPATAVDFAGNSTKTGGRGGHILQMTIAGP